MDEALTAQVADQLMTASTALAGLILIFIGNVVAGFESYEKPDRKPVISMFRRRGWLAFWGFAAALASSLSALASNWVEADWLIYGSVATLVGALGCVFVAALGDVRGIR